MKLRAGMAVSQAVADLKNLDNVIDWVEPNYLVGKTDLVPAKRLTAPSRRKLVGVAPRKALPAAVAKMIQAGAATNDPQFSGQWSLSNIGQNGGNYGSDIKVQGAWGVTTGDRRTTVAIIDTGLDVSHSDLKANVFRNLREFNGTAALDDDQNGYVDDRIGWNFVANTNNVTDDNGHGTHMAGIVAAVGNNNVGISGVMWNASILPLKALDAQGTGTISDVVEAIDYAIAQKVSVILCAFGTDGNSKALKEAIDRAAMSGIIVVTSAGNDGQNLHDSPQFPACYTSLNLLTVAASGNTDNIATFSNYGQGAHIAAPGVDILTTGIGDTYGNITGSSASAALGAGVAGLLKSLRPWVSAQAVRASIVQGARQLGWLNGNVSSSGILSASEAIEQFLAMPEDERHHPCRQLHRA